MSDRKTMVTVALASINISPNPLRRLNDEKVKHIASSMQRIGLMTPIHVRYHEGVPSADCDDSFEIIVGRHRYAAAKLLGWEDIAAVEVDCSDLDAKLWEIAENLHRAELTKLEHDEQVALWIELTDSNASQVATHKKGQQPGGVRAAARELGVGKDDAHRAVKVASLSNEAKAAAREHGLDDNRSALLTAARESDPEDQVAKIVELATEKTKPKPAPIEASNEDEANDFFVAADVPGSAATNKLIKKIVDFRENIDPSFTAWTENNPDAGAAEVLLEAVMALHAFALDLGRRVYRPITKKHKADKKISRAYAKRFGPIFTTLDPNCINLMSASLASGIDQLADEKRKQKEYAEQQEREHQEFLATPITAETEQHYTALITQRGLYEGACELSWPMYFKYRDEHPDLPPLSQDDLEYAGMWTSCAVRP